MIIHVIEKGDTLSKIGQKYNVDYKKIAKDNEISIDKTLVVGQTLVIITEEKEKSKKIIVNGFVFPNINLNNLIKILPYLSFLSIFSYMYDINGNLNIINDDELINISKSYNAQPLMVITNISIEGRFSSDLAHFILNNENIQNILINNILMNMRNKGYSGLVIDFEYVYPKDKKAYINFIKKVKKEIKKYNYYLLVALAPKTSSEQTGLLYEAHDYESIGILTDYVILMTYEWGYSGGPAMAVAPINAVTKVLEYATKVIEPNKILMGIPTYGYDWTLPFIPNTFAKSINNVEAVNIARNNKQSINYDFKSESPFFNYYDAFMQKHEVWFDDARSILAKFNLVTKFNLAGISYWTINRPFPQNYLILDYKFKIKK